MKNTPTTLAAAIMLTAALAAGACSSDSTTAGTDIALDASHPTPTSSTTTEPVAPSPTTADEPSPPPEEPLESSELQLALDTIVADSGVPAVGAAMFDRDGVIHIAVSGVRQRGDTTKATAGDLFHLGSNTKAMTAALLARLSEQGQGISFDTTLADAFPANATMHEDYVNVTIGQLLTHTGGAPGDEVDVDETILSMPVVEGRALGTELVLSEPPARDPGTVSSYSNAGYVIVGSAMETATGTSWEDLMIAEIFEPLGMTSCAFGPPGTATDTSQPSGHDESGQPIYWDIPQIFGPAGTVHCTMADWGTFLVEMLHAADGNSDFLTQASIQRLVEPAAVPVEGFPDGQSAAGWLVIDGPDGPDGPGYYHNGSNTAWYSQAVILPNTNRVILAVANEEASGEQAAGMAFAALSELDAGQ